jgi:hypothetical protein
LIFQKCRCIISIQDNSGLKQAVLWREYYIKEKSIMQLNQQKIEFMKKIANARLSLAELQAIESKTDEILQRRNSPRSKEISKKTPKP